MSNLKGKTNKEALGRVKALLEVQEKKGYRTYSHYIEEADFTPSKMCKYALEEATDLLVYLVDTERRVKELEAELYSAKSENVRLWKEIERLRNN